MLHARHNQSITAWQTWPVHHGTHSHQACSQLELFLTALGDQHRPPGVGTQKKPYLWSLEADGRRGRLSLGREGLRSSKNTKQGELGKHILDFIDKTTILLGERIVIGIDLWLLLFVFLP